MAESSTPRFYWPEAQIRRFCRRWKIADLAVFGSALRDDFRPDSDLDLLVRFEPDASWSLIDHARMEQELEQVVGRKVDLITRAAIEESPNWVIRKAILTSVRTLYAR